MPPPIISNGLFQSITDKPAKEQGFFCMQLVTYINAEAETFEMRSRIWNERFDQAKAGVCHYREQCPIHARTIAKQSAEQSNGKKKSQAQQRQKNS